MVGSRGYILAGDGWWWVGGGSWWVVMALDGWWWVVVGGGIVQSNPIKNVETQITKSLTIQKK